jgi:integrase
MATFKKRGDSWYAQVRRKGFPAQYRTFRSKADAQAWARELESRIDRRELSVGYRLQDSSLGDLLRRYDSDVVPRLRGASQEKLRIGKMLRAEICALTLDALTPSAFATYRDARLAEAMPQTVKHELALFSRIITLARREWDVPLQENPVQRITLPVVHNSRNRRLEEGEIERLVAALAKTRNPLIAPAITLALETAMRRGELLAIEWQHVDLQKRTVLLPQTKNGRPREVPLIPKGVDQNPWAHWRSPRDMMRQGCSTSLFQAKQQWSTMSS